jgi:polyisoprenoid-binding protein YceI
MPAPFRSALPLAAFAIAALCAPAQAAPPAWTVDKAASRLTFKSSFSGDAFEGAFRRWDAQIAFDPKQLAASKAVVTIETGSAFTGNVERDEALPTGDWFNVGKFPRATFVTRSFKDLGGGRYQAIGDLTIRGVSKPMTLPFTLAITGDTAKMTSSVSINRNLFGVGQGQFASAETVPLNVTLNISLTAKKGK